MKKSDQKPPEDSPLPAPMIDTDLLREIVKLLDNSQLTEIVVEKGDLRIRVARQVGRGIAASPSANMAPQDFVPRSVSPTSPPDPKAFTKVLDPVGVVKSPMVGTIYRRPNPESKPFVEVGSQVKAGEKILLIEAMKTFNEIRAPHDGIVTEIFVRDGVSVGYDESLLVISAAFSP